MKKKLIQYVSVLLSFLAGLFLTSYLTQVGNRDMTTSMAEAVLPYSMRKLKGPSIMRCMDTGQIWMAAI